MVDLDQWLLTGISAVGYAQDKYIAYPSRAIFLQTADDIQSHHHAHDHQSTLFRDDSFE